MLYTDHHHQHFSQTIPPITLQTYQSEAAETQRKQTYQTGTLFMSLSWTVTVDVAVVTSFRHADLS